MRVNKVRTKESAAAAQQTQGQDSPSSAPPQELEYSLSSCRTVTLSFVQVFPQQSGAAELLKKTLQAHIPAEHPPGGHNASTSSHSRLQSKQARLTA